MSITTIAMDLGPNSHPPYSNDTFHSIMALDSCSPGTSVAGDTLMGYLQCFPSQHSSTLTNFLGWEVPDMAAPGISPYQYVHQGATGEERDISADNMMPTCNWSSDEVHLTGAEPRVNGLSRPIKDSNTCLSNLTVSQSAKNSGSGLLNPHQLRDHSSGRPKKSTILASSRCHSTLKKNWSRNTTRSTRQIIQNSVERKYRRNLNDAYAELHAAVPSLLAPPLDGEWNGGGEQKIPLKVGRVC